MSAKPASVPPSETARQGGVRGLAALLFTPSPHIVDVDERRRARLLAVSLFLMAPALVVGVLSRMAARGESGWEMIPSVPVLAIAYWMSRTRLLWTDLREVLEASNKAAVLTRQLLAFSRRQVLHPKPVDLNQVLDGVGKMLRRLTREDVALELKPCVDLGTVRVDASQIDQVILNLVVNASDARPDGGTLTVATENVVRSDEPDVAIEGKLRGPYSMLSVADTGLGMEPDVKARVFEPFFTTKERGHGTGLGLATVYGIVSRSGGLIELDTKPGDGSTFRVLLPQIEEQGTTPAPGLGDLPGGTERILVVEDELEVRRLVAKMLERLGYHVVIAENGAAALAACRHGEGPLDLVLTDVVMPKMSGPECVSQLKAIYPDLGVLYMSGHAEPALDHRGVIEPGVALVQEPFTLEALASRLRQALDSRVETSS